MSALTGLERARRREGSGDGRGARWLLGTVGVLAVVVVAGTVAAPDVTSAPPASQTEPVASTTRVCPDPVADAGRLGSRITAFVAPGQPGQDAAAGRAAIAAVPARGPSTAIARITQVGGSAELLALKTSLPPVLAQATGRLAPGFIADQLTFSDTGELRGLAATACPAPGSDVWFVGGGAGVGRTSTVVVANTEDAAAQVDVLLYGPDGPLAAPGGRGVVVPARSQLRLSLSALAPGVAVFAAHVVARTGRIAAALSDRAVDGLVPKGVDWVPTAAPPSRRVIVPGIPPEADAVSLQVLSPDADADVSIRAITRDGAFVPVGAERLAAPAGQVSAVDLTKALDNQVAAIELTSNRPVVAGVRYAIVGKQKTLDIGYSAGAAALSGTAAVSGLVQAGEVANRLVLTAPAADAKVVLTLVPAGATGAGASAPLEIQVAGGRTGLVTLTAPPGEARTYSAVITPVEGSGPVYVARSTVQTGVRGRLVTGYPLASVRSTVTVPAAGENLGITVPQAAAR